MHGLLVTGLFLVATLAPATPSQKPSSSREKDPDLRLTGCVSPQPNPAGDYTFTQAAGGSRYRLTGNDMKAYAGRRVDIATKKGTGLSVRGGLVPSANVAAQAGHIDSAQAAIASQPGVHTTGKPDEKLPELRVASVRSLEGACK